MVHGLLSQRSLVHPVEPQAPVAQGIERRPSKPDAARSNRAGGADLVAELATPLNALERAHGGAPARPAYGPDMETVAALWELLAYVMGEKHAPRPGVVSQWKATAQTAARRWGERELARKVLGTSGRPSFSPPPVLEKYALAAGLAP